MPHLPICVLLLLLVILELSFSLHMSKITSFCKGPRCPRPLSNTSASGDDDLEPPKNKSLKSGSNRDNTALQWQKDFTIGLGYKVVEGLSELAEEIRCKT